MTARSATIRQLLLALVASIASGCTSSTGPERAIEVRVADDRGAPVERMRVVVTLSGTDRQVALTRKDGTATIDVRNSGSYQVTVIPRAGYVGVPGTLTTTVTVAGESRAEVGFTVHREGIVFPIPNPEPTLP